MGVVGPYTPPHGSAHTDGVSYSSTPPCGGGAASWEYDGEPCVSVMQVDPGVVETAGLYDWRIPLTSGYQPTNVLVEVAGWGGDGVQTLGVQIFLGRAPVVRSDMITQVIPNTGGPPTFPWSLSYSGAVNVPGEGWDVMLSKENIEDAQFYVYLTFDKISFSVSVTGVRVTITEGTAWDRVDVYAEPAWRYVNAGPESAFNTDAEFAEQAWRSINGQAAGR